MTWLWIIHLAIKKLFLLSFYSESEENKCLSSSPWNIFFLIVTAIAAGRFNIHFSKTLSVLHLFIPDIGSKVSQLPPSSITLKIFYKRLTPREQTEIDCNKFVFLDCCRWGLRLGVAFFYYYYHFFVCVRFNNGSFNNWFM